MSKITQILNDAIIARHDFFNNSHAENTNSYRIFHGVNDGFQGLTIDRYGSSILIQTFREPLIKEELDEIKEIITKNTTLFATDEEISFVYNNRTIHKEKDLNFVNTISEKALEKKIFKEMNLNYVYQARHRGQDPFLFLDMRAGRRFIIKNSKDLSFLNLFSYTNASGICAMQGGSKEVLNIDFAESSLEIGEENAKLNNFIQPNYKAIKSDVFFALRQLTGTPFKGRNGIHKKEKIIFKEKTFDLVFLDPPAWSKSPYGTIDLVRDYQSIFKLSLLATSKGGRIIAVNNVGKVNLNEWLEILKRCASKIGRNISNIEVITPEEDFPSKDKNYPLKIAVCDV
ncbi:MAG: class I SAM-dependent methyltransferase [Cyanobacteriota bacterium]